MKSIGLFFIIVFFLLGAGQVTAVSETQIHLESIVSEPDPFEHPKGVPYIEINQPSVRFDSVGLDSFIRYVMETQHFPGVATWCSKNGQVIWQQSYGYANLEDSIAVMDTTSFLLASISKTFVATAIMQLWERGLFNLDDDINNYLSFNVRNPYYPDSTITFRMLMTHTSSIHDNWGMLPPWLPGDHPVPLGDFVYGYLVPGGIYYSTANYNDTMPGVCYDYSNAAIALLGHLVETLEDSFPVHCQDSIFIPLGMNHTSWFLSNLDTNNVAARYQWTGTNYVRYPHSGCAFYPAAQLRASSVDIARHLTAIQQYGVIDTVRILDSATVNLMLTPHFGGFIGLTWFYGYYQGRWIWYHGGGMTGVSTLYGFCPAENSAVVVLVNRGSSSTNTYPLVGALFDYAQQYGIEEHESSQPTAVILQISPNPFRQSTNIKFIINDSEYTPKKHTLIIYDATGRIVKSFRIMPDFLRNTLSWDGVDDTGLKLPSGVYFLQFQAGNCSTTEMILLIR